MTETLYEKIKSYQIYDLFKTSSAQVNKELHHKFGEYPILTDFLKHYTNIDIKILNKDITNLFLEISSLADINSLNDNFKSNNDQYISEISKLYLLFNAIHDINDYIGKILSKIRNLISSQCEWQNLDKHFQEKIKELTTYILNCHDSKKYLPWEDYFDTKEKKFDYKSKSNKLLNIEKIELLKDLLEKDSNINNNKIIPNLVKSQKVLVNLENNKGETHHKNGTHVRHHSNNHKLDGEINHKHHLINNESKLNTKEENYNKKENIENIDSNDINDYITSIPKDSLFMNRQFHKKREKFLSHDNINEWNVQSTKQCLYLDKNQPEETSEQLLIIEDSKIYADLLEIIYELYKDGKITYEQKIKLKQLIIKKCPKILNTYKYFMNKDDENFIKELTALV